MTAPQFTNPEGTLDMAAKTMLVWLNAWRLLILILGILAVLGMALGAVSQGAYVVAAYGLNTAALGLALVTALLIAGLFIWLCWDILSRLMAWVVQAVAVVNGDATASGLQPLQQLLSGRLNLLVWLVLVWQILSLVAVWGSFSLLGFFMGSEEILFITLGLIVFAALYTGLFLVNTYFPIQALRGFLADATTRLNGQAQMVQPSANRLATWLLVVVVLQALSMALGLLPTPEFGLMANMLTIFIGLAFAAMIILPLLKLRQFADLLARVLDHRQGDNATTAARATGREVPMGLQADQREMQAATQKHPPEKR